MKESTRDRELRRYHSWDNAGVHTDMQLLGIFVVVILKKTNLLQHTSGLVSLCVAETERVRVCRCIHECWFVCLNSLLWAVYVNCKLLLSLCIVISSVQLPLYVCVCIGHHHSCMLTDHCVCVCVWAIVPAHLSLCVARVWPTVWLISAFWLPCHQLAFISKTIATAGRWLFFK